MTPTPVIEFADVTYCALNLATARGRACAQKTDVLHTNDMTITTQLLLVVRVQRTATGLPKRIFTFSCDSIHVIVVGAPDVSTQNVSSCPWCDITPTSPSERWGRDTAFGIKKGGDR